MIEPRNRSLSQTCKPYDRSCANQMSAPIPRPPRFFRRLLARFRLSDKAVCEESASLGVIDFHDYPDTEEGVPWHMVLHTCKRCGKRFYI